MSSNQEGPNSSPPKQEAQNPPQGRHGTTANSGANGIKSPSQQSTGDSDRASQAPGHQFSDGGMV
ncbi:hypothetical protein B0A52_08046 [Exophiala mesophila]|uniref:Uncharacterized protein n=1 Tax=Exophiala mesophila TaxID=212818 RepID=A0A438MZT0_EXOME|nr:hypothetical protein B0A52_08046 [Exophiala mesophila]